MLLRVVFEVNTYTMDNKSTKKPSLFDNLLDETDDEDIEVSTDDIFKLNKTDLQDTTLTESKNCDDLVRWFYIKY